MYGERHSQTGNSLGTAWQSLIDSRVCAVDTDNMANQAGDSFRDFGRKVEDKFNDTMPRVEEEVKKVIAYLNDEVVPGVRQNSSKALKSAAEQLAKPAEKLDRGAGGR
jgi:gas vesicle protein